VPPGQSLTLGYRDTIGLKVFLVGGAVAQLGARLDGIEEVVGSNPIGSTNFPLVQPGHMGYRMYRLHR
jgi:hypothetical protein